MAQIWNDISGSMNNVIVSNNRDGVRFEWKFITFSGEQQDYAEVRYRKANVGITSIKDRMQYPETIWDSASVISISRFEDRTTWTLVGGQYVPPAEASRRYNNITHVNFPVNTFSAGVWFIQVRAHVAGGDWTGWQQHKIEINNYDDQQTFTGTSGGQTKGPGFDSEGRYGLKVEVVSAAGVSTESAEVQFNVWETNKYLRESDGTIHAIPEHRDNGTQVGRVRRPA